jgi:soluble lytic murein transglycosylase-like protein
VTRKQLLWVLLGGSAWAYLLYNRSSVQTIAQTGLDTVTAALTGWQNVKDGPKWIPVLQQFEDIYMIPRNLLARIAYQESHFRPEIIQGINISSAGALGLMQLMPQYFTSVQRPVPFTDADTTDQIVQAATLLSTLFDHYGDWGLAVAAYNDGQGNIDQFVKGTRALPVETSHYVAQVLADVPVASGTFSA